MKNYTITALVSLAIGGAASHYYWPQLSKTSTSETTQNNITTETQEIIKPDGTKTVSTVTRDTSLRKERSTVVVAPPKPKWHVSVSATCDIGDLKCQKTLYGAQVEYNFVGPFSAGVRIDTNKQLGVVVGVSF